MEVETISTSTSKKLVLGLLILISVSSVSAQFYYNDVGNTGSEILDSRDSYFSMPEYDSQQEIASELVAPFIFITILLHFALSRALNFILAEDIEQERYHKIPYAIPLRNRHEDRLHPDARKYAMVMSLAITGSLVPTPYWDVIRAVMGSIGILTAVALGVLFLYGFYNVAQALT